MASISTIPPELLLDILSIAIASSLVTQPLIVHGQFSQLPSMCRTCCYRQIAGVCSTWAQIIREEFMARETVFGVYGSEKDEEVLAYVAKDQGKASRVKKVDASLRGWQGWKSLPPVASFDTTTEEEGEGTMGFLQTREVQLEKQRQQVLNRDRQRLVRLLTACRQVENFDIDVGFYSAIPHLPALFPSTIRTLILRNCNAQETFALIENLPLLDDLTLRLALDWSIPTSSPRPIASCRLRRFELSFTAFASATLPDILTLLSSSHETLTSLSLRNKGSSADAVKSFALVSSGLISQFAGSLEHLVVKDIPRQGRRSSDSEATWSWISTRRISFPHLRSLQLTGLPSLTADLFKSTFHLPSAPTTLERLTLEDFDSSSPGYLVDTLKHVPELGGLKLLEIAVSKQGEGSEKATKEIEAWCRGEGRQEGCSSELRASWKMRKVDHACGFW